MLFVECNGQGVMSKKALQEGLRAVRRFLQRAGHMRGIPKGNYIVNEKM